VKDVRVPQSWDGVEIGYHLGPRIVVAFLGGSLAQARPPALTTTPGFLVIDFTEIALRAAGLNASEARAHFVRLPTSAYSRGSLQIAFFN
jgi:hypothetical protein